MENVKILKHLFLPDKAIENEFFSYKPLKSLFRKENVTYNPVTQKQVSLLFCSIQDSNVEFAFSPYINF